MTAHPDATAAPVSTPATATHAGRRAAQLVVGLVLYAVSIALLVHSGLGNMPWDVLNQGTARQIGWSLGTVTVAYSVLILLAWWPLRQRPGIGTVANVVVIGVLIDPFLALLDLLPEELPLAARIAMVVLGIVVNGVASALYIGARLGPGPRDGLMTGLVARTGWPVGPVRIAIEVTVVAVGWLLGGTVGFATLAYALGIGPLIHWLLPRLTVPVPPAVAAAEPAEPGEGR
ncbi:membrane protein YczE [Cellulomonas pakistanensis]|uniref:Membrane protein n=1 Tax=Cellulomonas pakistanensis TaxID=992287 RepID=A0A919U6W6_9CELL|nr:hypothetical protein [Cellulomonas pakistanensis]GIG36670.1 membrane protein [Cellulomonas pakistanensis]